MNEGGFIKLSRKLIGWRWYKNIVTKSVFIHLLFIANYGESEVENVKIHRGQAVISYPSLAESLGITIQQARTALDHLKSTGEITVTRHPKFQIVTVINYNSYQSSTGKSTGKQQSNNSQANSQITPSKKNKNSTSYYKEEKEGASAECPSGGNAPEWKRRGFEDESAYLAYLRK